MSSGFDDAFVFAHWPTIWFFLTAHGVYHATSKSVVDVVLAAYQDEIDAWFDEVKKQISGRTKDVRELVPLYMLATQRIVNSVPDKAKTAMRTTVNIAVRNYETYSDDDLIRALARDWIAAYTDGHDRLIKRLDMLEAEEKRWYSQFLRPYAIMYFFYSMGKILIRDYILAGAQTVLQYGAFYAPNSLRPLIRTGLNVIDNLENLTARFRAVWAGAKKQVAYAVWTLLSGSPLLGIVGPVVAAAGTAFLAGMLLGKIIFPEVAQAAELPAFDDSAIAAADPMDIRRLKIETTEVGGRANAIYSSIKTLDDWSKAGGGTPYDPVRMLDELSKSVDGLTVVGDDYMAPVRMFLGDYIDRVRKQVADMKLGGAAADTSIMDKVDMFDVYMLLKPYIEKAFKAARVDDSTDQETLNGIMSSVVRDNQALLKAYGRDLAFKEQNDDMPPDLMAGYEAMDLVEQVGNLVRAGVDVRFIEDGVSRLNDISGSISDPQVKSMVLDSIQMFDEYIVRAKEAVDGR